MDITEKLLLCFKAQSEYLFSLQHTNSIWPPIHLWRPIFDPLHAPDDQYLTPLHAPDDQYLIPDTPLTTNIWPPTRPWPIFDHLNAVDDQYLTPQMNYLTIQGQVQLKCSQIKVNLISQLVQRVLSDSNPEPKLCLGLLNMLEPKTVLSLLAKINSGFGQDYRWEWICFHQSKNTVLIVLTFYLNHFYTLLGSRVMLVSVVIWNLRDGF